MCGTYKSKQDWYSVLIQDKAENRGTRQGRVRLGWVPYHLSLDLVEKSLDILDLGSRSGDFSLTVASYGLQALRSIGVGYVQNMIPWTNLIVNPHDERASRGNG